MSDTDRLSRPDVEAPTPSVGTQGPRRARVGLVGALGTAAALLLLGGAVLLSAAWHLTQGTSGVGLGDLLALAGGEESAASAQTRDILLGSRLPRLAAGVTVGFALGVAGALFQSLARNALASPDTLGVTGGAYLAVTAVAAFGLGVPLWASGAVAFTGGLLAAGLVLGLAGGAGASTTRLVLGGSAVALALQAATSTLLILFREETTGLFAWGSGSLSQLGLSTFQQMAPIVVVATACGLLLSRRLDLLGLGDDTAAALGVRVRTTRAIGTVLAVLLTASAVTLAGPIGFVGLCAPVITRLLGRLVPALLMHSILLPAAGLVGALLVVLADVLLRGLLGADEAIAIPTGVTTTLVGAVVLIVLARRGRDSGPTRQPPGGRATIHGTRRYVAVLVLLLVATVGVAALGLLAGSTWLRLGDVLLWAGGGGEPLIRFALDERAPRVAAALLAGGALALSGTMVQSTCRNPLAEPGLLGITGGAGLGAVISSVTLGGSSTTTLASASLGAMVAFGLVYALSWRGGLNADRLVLVGIGFWYGSAAATTYLLLRASPWDTPTIYTFLSGTTYGRSWDQVVPVGIALLLALPLAMLVRRELDLLALDEDTPRLVGVGLERVRLGILVVAALLAAFSVAAVGVVGFVGLVAPHAAKAIVGGRHARTAPVAALLGMVLLGVADTIGRTAIAPAQIPAGLIVALIGAPYFIYLLARSRV